MSDLLSDQTWRQLDPSAGRLSGRERGRAFLVVVVVLLLAVAATAGVRSGLLAPRVTDTGSSTLGFDRDPWVMHYAFEIVNEGRFPVEVVSVGRAGPGLVPAPPPAWENVVTGGRLEPGDIMQVGVAYEVTDCQAVPAEPWPVPVRIARPWGTWTVWIELPTQDRWMWDLPPDKVTGTGGASWDQVEWQRSLADAVCHYRAGGEPWVEEEG